MTNTKSLAIAGLTLFVVFVAFLYATSTPAPVATRPAPTAVAPAPVVPPAPAPVATELPDARDDDELPDPDDVNIATALDDGGYFDDSSYPDDESQDDLLVIDNGDSTRYITPTDEAAERARQQRAKAASLNASGFVGDDRVRAISTLGSYAGEGNSAAVAELRRMLQSTDDELRGDALDALAELLPGTDVVPGFSPEPPTDSDIERIIQALQSRE
ncbi:MAG: hypothetical protein V2J12_06635 [Gammaproteobacteria bacterium]|jgi:hypothetical protein|nr:hypothetical protein [Gammaproteobacteria bacterium]